MSLRSLSLYHTLSFLRSLAHALSIILSHSLNHVLSRSPALSSRYHTLSLCLALSVAPNSLRLLHTCVLSCLPVLFFFYTIASSPDLTLPSLALTPFSFPQRPPHLHLYPTSCPLSAHIFARRHVCGTYCVTACGTVHTTVTGPHFLYH